MAITIRAGDVSGINYNSYLSSYFAGLSSGGYEFNGGTPDTFYGRTFYMNGPQAVFSYEDSEGTATDNLVVFDGDALAYDYIHYGPSYGHGISGQLDTMTFALSNPDTAKNADGILTGYTSELTVSGLDLSVLPGSGIGNPLMLTWDAAAAGDYEYLYDLFASQAQIFHGSAGNDSYVGTAFDDKVFGYDGNDVIDGGAGADRMAGGNGDDLYFVDNTGDRVVEAKDAGYDTVKSTVSFALSANVEQLRLLGDEDIDGTGNKGANFLRGNAGDNVLDGGKGADRLLGEAGDDTLIGGFGRDVLTGGAGNDAFVYNSLRDSLASNRDVIKDFGDGDLIDLSGIEIKGVGSFEFAGEGKLSGQAGELVYRTGGSHTMVLGDADGDGHADFAIKLVGVHNLSADDFLL